MALTQFARQLKQVHDLLVTPNAPGIRGMELVANNDAQLVLICEALDRSGCIYTLINGEGTNPQWLITVTGSKDQIRACVETLLGY